MPAACPACGSNRVVVKTLQMHVFTVEDKTVEMIDEDPPMVFEVLCDECDAALPFESFDADVRRDVLLRLGAR